MALLWNIVERSLFAWLDTYLPSLGTYLVLVVQFSHVDFLLRIYLSRICLSQHKLTMGKIKDQPISIYLDLKPHLVLVVQFSHVVHITIDFINNPHFIFWKFPRYLSGLPDIFFRLHNMRLYTIILNFLLTLTLTILKT